MINKRILAIAALLSGFVGAHAGTMTNVGSLYGNNLTINGSGSFGGIFNFTESGLGSIQTVCADLYHSFAWNSSWSDQVWSPATSYTALGNGYSPLLLTFKDANSLGRAGNILAYGFSNFSGLVTGSGFSNNDVAEALQITVWAALYSDATPGTLSWSGDSLTIGNAGYVETIGLTDGNHANVKSMTNTLWAQRNTTGTATFIQQLSNPSGYGQDMLTGGQGHYQSTPEPVTMSLGFAAVGLFVRRRLKAKKA